MLSLANGSPFERATDPTIPPPPPGPAQLTIPLVHAEEQVESGIGLSLSGGGYRAMLFHVGSLWRLNEAGLLPQLQRISSVSGGSITAGQLALAWDKLNFDKWGEAQAFQTQVVTPLRTLANKTIDIPSILKGVLIPGRIGAQVAAYYQKLLFGTATLQHLPNGHPTFVFNATNVQTGSLWRFTKDWMADWQVGIIRSPQLSLATVVAASSAFPPFLSPIVLQLDPKAYDTADSSKAPFHYEPFTTKIILTDGGVYDNLGLETVWKKFATILVSDGGKATEAQGRPARNWISQAFRITNLIDRQVRSLRKRQLLGSLSAQGQGKQGVYWGIGSNIQHFQVTSLLSYPMEQSYQLAKIPTRLAKLSDRQQKQLINWGYAICDAALRKHYPLQQPLLAAPRGWPYPEVAP